RGGYRCPSDVQVLGLFGRVLPRDRDDHRGDGEPECERDADAGQRPEKVTATRAPPAEGPSPTAVPAGNLAPGEKYRGDERSLDGHVCREREHGQSDTAGRGEDRRDESDEDDEHVRAERHRDWPRTPADRVSDLHRGDRFVERWAGRRRVGREI